MSRNIEIKARIENVDACTAKVAALADQGPEYIAQDDTFFRCDTGRLKLRTFADGTGELIYYRRPNECGPKESFYVRSPTASPDSLRECLSLAYGQVGRVRKQRKLFLIGRTRVHLDEVERLGRFIELEVVLADDEPAEAGIREARDLMEKLGIEARNLLDDAYVDLPVIDR
ncbi:MAG: adenylate cyclase, class [Gammaproteobacteria bacterium]|nr:adenylate cyclase, class [Gammaproteobacteria bacterium]